MGSWSWQKWVGKLLPWVLAAVSAFFKEVLEIDVTWWPTLVAVLTGIVQFILSLFPPKVEP